MLIRGVGGMSPELLRRLIMDYASPLSFNLCDTKGKAMNSLLRWLHLVLSNECLETSLLDVPDEEGMREIIHEYSESPSYKELDAICRKRHAEAGRCGEPIIVAIGDYFDRHGWFRQSLQAFFAFFPNMKRSVRRIPWMMFVLAEMSGDTAQINTYREFMRLELAILRDGVEIRVDRLHMPAWIYGGMVVQPADSVAQHHNTSVISPTGERSCPECYASRADFAALTDPSPKLRRTSKSLELIMSDALSKTTYSEMASTLRSFGFMPDAPMNANLSQMLDMDVFEMQTCDDLHPRINDGRQPVQFLYKFRSLLKGTHLATLLQRIDLLDQPAMGGFPKLTSSHLPAQMRTCRCWKGYDSMNFMMLSTLLLEGLVAPTVMAYWESAASFHHMLSAMDIHTGLWPYLLRLLSKNSKKALKVFIPGPLTVPKKLKKAAPPSSEDGDMSGTDMSDAERENEDEDTPSPSCSSPLLIPVAHSVLSSHRPLHLPASVCKFGPAANFSTSTGEHAQGDLGSFAAGTTRDADDFALQHQTAWQLHMISCAVCKKDSPQARQLAAAMASTKTLRHHATYFNLPLVPGAVVVQVLPFSPPADADVLPFLDEVFSYAEIIDVDTASEKLHVQYLKVPHVLFNLVPFPLQYAGDAACCIRFSSIHRVVWKAHLFVGSSALPSPSLYVIPSRFITLEDVATTGKNV